MNGKLIMPAVVNGAAEEDLPRISCGRCFFHVGGGCHFNPPMPHVVGVDKLGRPVSMGFWPPTGERDWCGQFSNRVQEDVVIHRPEKVQ